MSLAPGRLNSPWANVKNTPPNSPYNKTSSPKNSLRSAPQDSVLVLKQVIGTTAGSANAFDSLPPRSFAFTAGAAAVVATIDDDQQVSQRFFRARPSSAPTGPTSSPYQSPTPSRRANDSRTRGTASLRDTSAGSSSFGSPGNDKDSPWGKSWSAKDRVKAATCVCFSPNGKFLAVGETGYKPRVLIFSLSPEASSDLPLAATSEHEHGVSFVAFSPDSQYLASLGATNDGFIRIWNVNQRTGSTTLHSSNRCISTIMKMAWLGSAVITVGVRYVKVWRIPEPQAVSPSGKTRFSEASTHTDPASKVLQGRNCKLGAMVEATFTWVVAVTSQKALVSTDRGDLCVIDNSESCQSLNKLLNVGFAITAMALDQEDQLHVAGMSGEMTTFDVQTLLQSTPDSDATRTGTPTLQVPEQATWTEAMASLDDFLVTVDSSHVIRLLRLKNRDEHQQLGDVARQLPAHGDAVLGVRALPKDNNFGAAFYTWSADGTVLLWSCSGRSVGTTLVNLEQGGDNEEGRNELKTVHVSKDATYLIAADKFGFFSVLDLPSGERSFHLKAHAGEVMDTVLYEGKFTVAATCSRDRTVQVYFRNKDQWDLLQTLDEHTGAVTSLLFSSDGNKFISGSTDRNVVVREAVTMGSDENPETVFVIARTIPLKTKPTAMKLDPRDESALYVTTMDRQILKIDLNTGRIQGSFKASDPEGNDAVVLTSLTVSSSSYGPLLCGICSTDKSLRVYDCKGALLGRDYGHTEGVSDVALVVSHGDSDAEKQALVTVAVDGTIFVWSLNDPRQSSKSAMSKSTESLVAIPASIHRTPVRRVLSHSELARFRRPTPDDNGSDTEKRAGRSTPHLRKKSSALSLSKTPKKQASKSALTPNHAAKPESNSHSSTPKKYYRARSPSPAPPSPRSTASSARRPSAPDMRAASRQKSIGNMHEYGGLASSADSVCRNLRAYRKKLHTASDTLPAHTVEELQKELGLTARAVGEKAVKEKTVDQDVMVKLLNSFSEQLLEQMDERLARRLAGKSSIESLHAHAQKGSSAESMKSARRSSISAESMGGCEERPATGDSKKSMNTKKDSEVGSVRRLSISEESVSGREEKLPDVVEQDALPDLTIQKSRDSEKSAAHDSG